jgi:MFS family permease
VQAAANTLFFLNIAPFLMQNSTDDDRAFLFSADFSLMSLAIFFGTLVAGGLPTALALRMGVDPESAEAYRAAMFIGVALNLLALVPVWMTREIRWPGPRTTRRFRLRDALHLKAPVAKLMLPNLMVGFAAALLIPYMNLFFKGRFLVDDQTLGRIFAPMELFVALTVMAGPALASRLGKIRTVAFTELASVGFLLVLGFAPLLHVATAAYWIRGALMNMGYPLFAAFVMEQSPHEERGTVNSIMQMAWQVGWIVSPFISAAVQAAVGFSPLFLASALLYGLGAVLTYAFFHAVDQRPAEDGLPVPGDTEIIV